MSHISLIVYGQVTSRFMDAHKEAVLGKVHQNWLLVVDGLHITLNGGNKQFSTPVCILMTYNNNKRPLQYYALYNNIIFKVLSNAPACK